MNTYQSTATLQENLVSFFVAERHHRVKTKVGEVTRHPYLSKLAQSLSHKEMAFEM